MAAADARHHLRAVSADSGAVGQPPEPAPRGVRAPSVLQGRSHHRHPTAHLPQQVGTAAMPGAKASHRSGSPASLPDLPRGSMPSFRPWWLELRTCHVRSWGRFWVMVVAGASACGLARGGTLHRGAEGEGHGPGDRAQPEVGRGRAARRPKPDGATGKGPGTSASEAHAGTLRAFLPARKYPRRGGGAAPLRCGGISANINRTLPPRRKRTSHTQR